MQYPAESALLANLVAETTKQCYNDFVAADDYTRARMIGRVVGEVVIALVATKGAIKAISALKDTKLFTSLMSNVAKGKMAGEEAVAALETATEGEEALINAEQISVKSSKWYDISKYYDDIVQELRTSTGLTSPTRNMAYTETEIEGVT